MAQCSDCGATVPLKKSLGGRPLSKDDPRQRDCPECGKPLGKEDRRRGALEK